MTPALLIMGPTASGKSALALALAARLDGEIVNADSMQVYRDFRVLTARPTPEEEALAPHHLYGHVDAAALYSVGHWLREALGALQDIAHRGRRAIIVGGTGLYFKALTQGVAPIPEIAEDLRARLRERLACEGVEALHAALLRVDPETASRLSRRDAPRILRALEVWEATSRSISQWQAETTPPLAASQWTGCALMPARAELYAAIDRRFESMLDAGALDEARAFAARQLGAMLPAMKAHGAPALLAHLRGEMSLKEVATLACRDTRRYAKRQFTWIANQLPSWKRIHSTTIEDRVTELALGA